MQNKNSFFQQFSQLKFAKFESKIDIQTTFPIVVTCQIDQEIIQMRSQRDYIIEKNI